MLHLERACMGKGGSKAKGGNEEEEENE
eukprot:SAG11_NODE_34584_length_271_cov_0.598837_1_plen_27_part_10